MQDWQKALQNHPANTKYRVVAYIDGFNLYNGMKSKTKKALKDAAAAEANGLVVDAAQLRATAQAWVSYRWLNVKALVEKLLKPDQELVRVKYFTARVSTSKNKMLRQNTYLEALGTLPDIEIIEGQFQPGEFYCPVCKHTHYEPREKRTDVNIGIHLLKDALDDHYDTAILISGDSDLVPAVEEVLSRFPNKRVTVAFPPHRKSKELDDIASRSLSIGRANIRQSQFPEKVLRQDGFELERPEKWRQVSSVVAPSP